MQTAPIEHGEFVLSAVAHQAAAGECFEVRQMARQRIRGTPSNLFLQVRHSRDGGATWQTVPLRTWPWQMHRVQAADWPPEQALASAIDSQGRLQIDFENRWDPWAAAAPTRLQAHARWQARYDSTWRRWTLAQLHTLPGDAPARR